MKARSPAFKLAARVQTVIAPERLPRDRFAALCVRGIGFRLLELLWWLDRGPGEKA